MSKSNFHKITISGDIGSGKSVIAKMLSDKLGYKIYSTGSLQRKIAEQRGMNTLELNKYADKHSEIDQQMDEFSKSIRDSEQNCIVDSRMAWSWMPTAFKIYLRVSLDIAAERIMFDTSRKNEEYLDLNEAKSKIRDRRNSEVQRYIKRYGVDLSDPTNYDLVLDTCSMSPKQLVEIILDCYEKWLNNSQNNL